MTINSWLDTGCISLPIKKILSSAYTYFGIPTMNCAAVKYTVARVWEGYNLAVLAYLSEVWYRHFLTVLNYVRCLLWKKTHNPTTHTNLHPPQRNKRTLPNFLLPKRKILVSRKLIAIWSLMSWKLMVWFLFDLCQVTAWMTSKSKQSSTDHFWNRQKVCPFPILKCAAFSNILDILHLKQCH